MMAEATGSVSFLAGIGLLTAVAMFVVGTLRVASSISGGWPTLGVVFSFASSRGGGHGIALMVHGLAYGFRAKRQTLAARSDYLGCLACWGLVVGKVLVDLKWSEVVHILDMEHIPIQVVELAA